MFFPSKAFAGANSKSNRMNFLLSSGPHRDPPGDTQSHLIVQPKTRSFPSTPQLWSGQADIPLTGGDCFVPAHVWDSAASNANQPYGSKPCSHLLSSFAACLSETAAAAASSSVDTLRDSRGDFNSMGLQTKFCIQNKPSKLCPRLV